MEPVTIGLLPLSLKLYDAIGKYSKDRINIFYKKIAGELEKRNVSVLTVPICRLKSEFEITHLLNPFQP